MKGGDRVAERYELLRPVGSGGMAEVWLARSHGAADFSRLVALKRIRPNLAANREFADMFVEEARVVSALLHPHIVQVQDFVADEAGYAIIMDWIEGVDLGAAMVWYSRQNLEMPWPEVARIGLQVLTALDNAHGRRDAQGEPAPIFHRDVSPSNILLSVHGVAKLADFGLARAMDRMTVTMPGVVKGKLAYVAPEMVGGQRASASSDVYSLGVVLYEALAGRRLFEGRNELELFVKVGRAEIPALSSIREGLPPALLQTIEKMVAKHPHDRFESARAAADGLREALRDQVDDLESFVRRVVS